MSCSVRLTSFEGPLALLVHLVREGEVAIAGVPLAVVAEQYLAHLAAMARLDLDRAGEDLLLTATLLRWKARWLLPAPAEEEGEEDAEPLAIDPRPEYERFRALARTLGEAEGLRARHYPPGRPGMGEEVPEEVVLEEITLGDLLRALSRVLARWEPPPPGVVEAAPITLEERMDYLRALVAREGRASFEGALGASSTRLELIVTFLAVLELVRLREVLLRQDGPFGEIWISRRRGERPN